MAIVTLSRSLQVPPDPSRSPHHLPKAHLELLVPQCDVYLAYGTVHCDNKHIRTSLYYLGKGYSSIIGSRLWSLLLLQLLILLWLLRGYYSYHYYYGYYGYLQLCNVNALQCLHLIILLLFIVCHFWS